MTDIRITLDEAKALTWNFTASLSDHNIDFGTEDRWGNRDGAETWAWVSVTGTTEYEGQELSITFGVFASGNTDSFAGLYDFNLELEYDHEGSSADLDMNFVVVDEDDEEVDRWDIWKAWLPYEPYESAVHAVLPEEPEPEDLDQDTDTEGDETMQEYTIKRDNDRNLRFTGILLGSAESNSNNASGNYSGSTGRWTELRLYETKGGKYVCQSIGRTQWQGEHDRFSAVVATTLDEVYAFFGGGWLAKELYEDANIEEEMVEEVE